MPDYLAQRLNMVASQILAAGVTEERLLDAFREVARELFVPTQKRSIAYADAPIEIVHGRWLLAPMVFAKLLQLADIAPSATVLDVGCLTGYSTAILARIAGRVIGLEQDTDLVRIASEKLHETGARNASIVQGALNEGHRAHAPYDVIIINGAIEQRPERLLGQLAIGGCLVAILARETSSQAILYLKEESSVGHRLAFYAWAPILSGFRQPAGFVF